MTVFSPTAAGRVCARLLLSFGVLLAAPQLRAADEPLPGAANTFRTPGYPQSVAPRGSNAMPATRGAANPLAEGGTPSLQNPTGGPGATPYPRPGDEFAPRPADAAPPRPGEFQRFVESATGRLLPVFGSNFFAEAGNTFSSMDNVPVSADYTVGAGDEILLRAWGSIDVDYRAVVDRNGLLNLPKIGSFNVSGVKASELTKHLRAQIGRLYTNFDLSVSLGQLRGLRVFIVGPAQRPGVVTLASQSTLLAAVVMAGGPASNGSMRKVLLRRDGRTVSELDIYEFLVQGDKSKDLQLAAGDVVVFQPAGPRVALNGALDTPAIYELKNPQESVREVLRYAGGTPALANPNRAQLERIDVTQPTAARFVETFALDAPGLQKPLRDGDVLTLLPISPQFANAVTLRGHVAQPLRYPYTPGMRIRDLIPDREALISPDFYRRKNLLVQVVEDDDDVRADSRQSALTVNNIPQSATERAVALQGDSGVGSGSGSGSGNAYGNGNGNGAATGRTRGVDATGITSALPRSQAERQRRREDRAIVNASKRAPTALFDDLNWDYAVIERLNRVDLTTQVIPFNLGRAVIQGDDIDNIALLAGDVVTVYSQRDIRVPVSRQTRLVALEGEVAAPGVYQLQPGDTLKSVIARAGGFTPQAYLYGLEFSREETRQRQRENLVAAITRLESLAAVQAARDAANRRDDAVGAASTAAVSNAATQAQLSRLRNVQPNGRIALELDADTASADALPNVPLEAGDRVIVPSRPGFVTVAGAVVNSNAFLWKPGRTAGEYLALAGADEAADPSNAFILRADGTVSHAGDKRGFFGRSTLQAQLMYPGDALIVPNQLDFETWGRAFVRNLKDFAQIFTGFGIGIAAINSL